MAKRKKKPATETLPAPEKFVNNSILPYEVAERYELNWKGGHTVEAGQHGRIDFRVLTLAKADKLFKAGFVLLKKR